MTGEVAGSRAQVLSITKVGAEIHHYEPTPRDIAAAEGADLVIGNGMGLELWLDQFIDQLGDVPSIEASDGVEAIPIRSGKYRGRSNPHAWMSPLAARTYVQNIRNALISIDPEGRAVYTRNADRYLAELDEVATGLRHDLGQLPKEHRTLVTCEGAFSYLTRDFGLTEAYLWPINAEAQGTPEQIAGTMELVERSNVPAVFCESTVNDAAQQQVARETGARLGGVLYVDSLSRDGGPVPTYLELLRHDARTIVDGLGDDAR